MPGKGKKRSPRKTYTTGKATRSAKMMRRTKGRSKK